MVVESALERLAVILQEVPAVHDLYRLRGAIAGTLRIGVGAVARADADLCHRRIRGHAS